MSASTAKSGLQLVQYGCGLSAPDGWRNFDASPTLRLQRIPIVGALVTRGRTRFPANVHFGDVVRGLPVASRSCDAVYCSHVLEHLGLDDLRTALRETYRILRPRGVFRGVLPDLEVLARAYISDPSADAATTFVQATLMGTESRASGLKGIVEMALGNSRHLWMWDYKSLAAELTAAGFKDVRPARFGDGSLPQFKDIEQRDRWEDSLGFECTR
ncbi:methyltransferase domain-containing protein [Sulfuriferula sp.]|uniref:class I SAM-dependent methyltransferase n=1 Tax=Sulfuriferula sp. TaxID=2025307 RepID=UPI0027319121|nr:methyltransferase domain-containing protein [Sulfuriferula sp.]MDP2024894.1 methyltransferase domain-containing protein [Sulfuriferula sp.]